MNKTVFVSFTISCLLSTVFLIALNIQTINANRTSLQTIYTTEPFYFVPTVHFTPTDVYITPFIPQAYEMSTFHAIIPYMDGIDTYIDLDELIYIKVLPDKISEITFVVHFNTYYPIIEIESSNISVLRFNLTELYEHYYKESYLEKVGRTQFTGLKPDSNVPIVFEIGMPEPKELWKITPEGTMTQLTDWNYQNSTVLLSFEHGGPTVSMIFGDSSTNYHNLLADFNALNMSYISLDSGYNNLMSDYDSLQSSYYQLNSSNSALQDSYSELQSDREAIASELSIVRNLMYIFVATTAMLEATTVYFAIRKPKIKP